MRRMVTGKQIAYIDDLNQEVEVNSTGAVIKHIGIPNAVKITPTSVSINDSGNLVFKVNGIYSGDYDHLFLKANVTDTDSVEYTIQALFEKHFMFDHEDKIFKTWEGAVALTTNPIGKVMQLLTSGIDKFILHINDVTLASGTATCAYVW